MTDATSLLRFVIASKCMDATGEYLRAIRIAVAPPCRGDRRATYGDVLFHAPDNPQGSMLLSVHLIVQGRVASPARKASFSLSLHA